jgi:stage IV sporulation protein B
VEISAIDRSAEGSKCFSVRVVDPALLEETGGIVQGMSGSPIVQNGKLIGAVTHVLIGDPSAGYGIFIENMLQAAA